MDCYIRDIDMYIRVRMYVCMYVYEIYCGYIL